MTAAEVAPYRAVAAAVLHLAWLDLSQPYHRQAAFYFLCHDAEGWCAVAGLDYKAVRARLFERFEAQPWVNEPPRNPRGDVPCEPGSSAS